MQIDEPTHSSRVDHAASAVHLPPTSSWRNTDTAMSDGFKPPLNRHAVAFTGRLVPVIAVVASIDAIAHIVASVWPGRPTWSSLDRTSWVLWTAQLILGLSIGIGVRTQGRSAHRQRQIAAVLSGAVVLMLVLAAGFRPHWALKLNPAFIAVLGFAVLATLFRRAGGALVGQALALAITTFTLTGLCAALYGYHSLHDGTVLLGLAAAVFYLRPSEGLAAKFNAATAGGSVLRRLPLLVLLPQLIDWLALEGQRVGYYGEDAGVLFQATVTTFFVGALVWSMATALHEKHCAFLSAEDELRASEERYRKLVDMSPFAIVVKSERRIEFANPAAQRMAGAEHPRQLLMRSPFTFIHPDARREFESGVCQVLRDGIAMPRMEKRIVRLDGTELDVELSVSPVDYHGQRLAQVVARDVTIQKRALDALRASEERFRVAFEEAAVGMALISTEGLFLRVNGKLCEITGHTPADLCERSIDGMTHPDDVALGRPQRERLLAGEISSYQIEKRCIRADGNLVWIAATVSVVRRIGGEPDYLIAFVEDISERRNLEAQIRQSQKLEAIGQLAGGVAHDFNNMLTAIYGHVALLEEQPALTPAGLESLHEIAEAARRATSLTRQLLLFSRREVVQPRTMDLNAAVTGMGKMLRRLIGEQIQMHVELHPAPLEIYADPGMVDQVLMNLAVNARDAMPTGGELRIETMLGRVDVQNTRTNTDAVAGVYACLEISDTGLGISPDVLPHIYEPFFTTKAPGKGTGLGLATVYGIMKQHHGWIEVATTEGSGTTFRAFFPLIDTSIEAPPLESLDPVLTVRGQGRTVLLVEDDGAIREMVQTILEHQGYTVIAATDAADALRRWRSNAELVLTDLVMPGSLDGRALAAELRCRRADLPVIFMTGYDAGLGGRPLDLGPRDGFLHKPFTRTQLFTLLAKLLTHRPSARASETSSDWMI